MRTRCWSGNAYHALAMERPNSMKPAQMADHAPLRKGEPFLAALVLVALIGGIAIGWMDGCQSGRSAGYVAGLEWARRCTFHNDCSTP